MSESFFLIFWIFFFFLFKFSPPGRVWAEFGSKILLFLSRPISSYLIPVWLKITPESCFLIFWIFLLFFFGIFSPGSSMSGIQVLNYFLSFSACLIPNLAKNNAEKLFSNFLNFFAIFFRNLLPRVENERNSGLKFFYLFLGLSQPISFRFC